MEFKNRIFFYFFLSWVCLASSNAEDYFVSLEGSNSGDGTLANPWLTIEYAIKQLRKLRPKKPGPENHVTLNIMAGTYFQSERLILNSQDSYLDIVSYNNEEVSISGGISAPTDLTWNKEGNILSTKVSISFPGLT